MVAHTGCNTKTDRLHGGIRNRGSRRSYACSARSGVGRDYYWFCRARNRIRVRRKNPRLAHLVFEKPYIEIIETAE